VFWKWVLNSNLNSFILVLKLIYDKHFKIGVIHGSFIFKIQSDKSREDTNAFRENIVGNSEGRGKGRGEVVKRYQSR